MNDEVIIHDGNYMDFINPIVDDEQKSHGLIPRDYNQNPHGSLMYAKAFDLPLIDQSEWQNRLDVLKSIKGQLSDIRNIGMNGSPIPSRDQNSYGFCVTSDTEVLTEKGWIKYPDYNWNDFLGTVNPLTHELEFQAPFEKHIYEYNGPMIYSTNRRIDFGVTPDHMMYVRKWDERQRTLSNKYTFQKAGNIGWYAGLLHAPSGFVGTELKRIAIPDDREYSGEDFLAFISLICSDGYAGGSSSTYKWVSFCNFIEEKHSDIEKLACRIGFKEQPGRRGVWTRYDALPLAKWIRSNCYTMNGLGSKNKKVPDIVKCVSTNQIKHFLKYFGDQKHSGKTVFYSASKRMIDDLQELHLRIGKRGSISNTSSRVSNYNYKDINSGPGYILSIAESNKLCIDKKDHIEYENYRGLVYCAAVPNHTLITRRNGSVLISSNCWAHSSTSACLILRALNNEPYADLSAFAVACMIKGFRDQGGWGAESLEWIAQHGIPTSEFWPQKSMSRSNDNPKTWENAAKHKVTEWMDLDPNDMKNQLVTCLLSGIPVVVDYNWWSHSVCAIDLVNLNPFQVRIWNSWTDSWSQNGTGILEGRKAIPDGAIAPRVIDASLS